MTESTDSEAPAAPPKAVHLWSLFRTMGRFVGPGSMPSGGIPERQDGGGVALLDLPAQLAAHGYVSAQVCHFSLASTDRGYLSDVRGAFDDAGVRLECFLIDDGDLASPHDADAQEAFVDRWLGVAEALETPRARVVAGMQPPREETLAASAGRLRSLAQRHPQVRVVTENWHALLPGADPAVDLLERTGGAIGFLVDLGNWTGEHKYRDLGRMVPYAETCQAKCRTTGDALDLDDYRRSLQVLHEGGYTGPLAMVYDGPDPDEWGHLEQAYTIVSEVFTN